MEKQNLKEQVKTLQTLCQELDPYGPISDEDIKKLESLGIENNGNPFDLTNELIFKLENAIEKLELELEKNRKEEKILH